MRKRQKILRLSLFLFLIFSCLLWNISKVGNYLVVNQRPAKSDVIIVLSGGDDRIAKGVQLFRENFADSIMLSNAVWGINNNPKDSLINQIKQYNIPQEKIIQESKADSTYQNALFTKKLMQKNKLKSAIVVSSNYHMRRVKIIFDKVYRGSGIKLTFCASTDPKFTPNHWWTNKFSFILTIDEYIKIAGNELGINGIEAKSLLRKLNNVF